jgi:dolichyl-phosphate-mannose-protein mannosyltransferase
VAGSVRSDSLDRSAKRTSAEAGQLATIPDQPTGTMDVSYRVMAAWRRLNVPVELVWLTFLAVVTRLVAITHPRAIVFDEVYFREFALRYLDGSFFFDIHPPLGKLLLAGWAKLLGISAAVPSADPVVALRVLPALAGAALVAVFYLFLRELTASRRVATFGAALLLLDNAILVESRLILVDSMLLLFGLSALTCYLAARRHTGRAHWILLTAAAVLAGMAASTKWTGLTTLGVIGFAWLARTLRQRVSWRLALPQTVILLAVPALVYVGTFALHFQLLPHSGPGDAFMSQRFQSTLAGNPQYDPAAQVSFTDKFIELNLALRDYNLSLDNSTHPYSSHWLSWPVLQRPVYYWTGTSTTGEHEYIYLLGNPVIWWGLLAGVVVVALAWTRNPARFDRHRGSMALLGLAWVANYLPFVLIRRPMFLYHYFFAFLFCLAAVSIGLGLLAGWMTEDKKVWQFPSRRSAAIYGGILALALAGFVFFAPISFGLPLSDSGLGWRIWLDSWR